MALVKMAEEFGGLPMESLIGGPLQAACDAQTMLAGATARFIEEVGLVKEGDKQVVRTVGFSFTRSANGDDGNDYRTGYKDGFKIGRASCRERV